MCPLKWGTGLDWLEGYSLLESWPHLGFRSLEDLVRLIASVRFPSLSRNGAEGLLRLAACIRGWWQLGLNHISQLPTLYPSPSRFCLLGDGRLLHATRSDVCLFPHSISLNLPSILGSTWEVLWSCFAGNKSRVLERIGIQKLLSHGARIYTHVRLIPGIFAKKLAWLWWRILCLSSFSPPLRLVPHQCSLIEVTGLWGQKTWPHVSVEGKLCDG